MILAYIDPPGESKKELEDDKYLKMTMIGAEDQKSRHILVLLKD